MPDPISPLQAMEDWERRLWEAHVGCWESDYTVRDGEGNVVDRHHAINDIALDWDRNIYTQRNIYTRGDQVEVRRYSAHWDGRTMRIQGKVLEGEAFAADERVVLLYFRKTNVPHVTLETIHLTGETTRVRTMQHIVDGRLAQVTSVFNEVRLKATPGIDVDGNDLDDRVP